MRVSCNGMRQLAIKDGDLMVIERSVEPCSGRCCVRRSSAYLSWYGQEKQQFLST